MPDPERAWLGVRLATFDEVEDMGHSGSLMDDGASGEGGAWWLVDVDWADDAFLQMTGDDSLLRMTEKIATDAAAVGLTLARINEVHGPGGGWPDVTLAGSFDSVLAFLADHHDDESIRSLSRDAFMPREEWADVEPIGTEGGPMIAGRSWASRLAAKVDEQIVRAVEGSEDDSDDDPEVTGALIEFFDSLELACPAFQAVDRVDVLRALRDLVDVTV